MTTQHLPHAKDLVTCLPEAESKLRQKVGEAVGQASCCWGNLGGAGEFQSEKALGVARELIDDIIELTGLGRPHLGSATTEELIAELQARSVFAAISGESWPKYRPVDET